MADLDSVIHGLAEISEYARAKADIAGIGKGKEVFDSWYRAVEDARELLREQEPVKPKEKQYKIVCGVCGEKLAEICGDVDVAWNDDGKYPGYCPGCGRKVKWDG